jgi:hypothetical protein
MRRGSEENQASAVLVDGAFARPEEFGAGLRPRLERFGGDETQAEDGLESDPVSPELILVSSPEVARRARERLPVFPSHRPAYDDRSALASRAPPALRKLQAAVPAALPETAVTRRRTTRWWATAAAIALAASVTGVVIRERHAARASKVSTQLKTSLPVPRVTGTTTPNNPLRSQSSSPAKPGRPKAATGSGVAPGEAPPATMTSKTATTLPAVEGTQPAAPRTAPKPQARARPTPPPPGTAPTFVPSRVFGWPADTVATGYLVRFFRDGAKVYETRSTKPRLTLPPSFRFLAGHYRWEVLPVLGSAPNLRYGPPIVESTFVLTAG